MKTSELIGPALDWAVAKCEGFEINIGSNGYVFVIAPIFQQYKEDFHIFRPSNAWALGGPIIERESLWVRETGVMSPAISHLVTPEKKWFAFASHHYEGGDFRCYYGETYLIAAMRAFVASKLGEEVHIPGELK